MTFDHLYGLYRCTYQEYDRRSPLAAATPRSVAPLARAVAEFAEADAQDGRPLRTLSEFRAALAAGAGALRPLGLSAA